MDTIVAQALDTLNQPIETTLTYALLATEQTSRFIQFLNWLSQKYNAYPWIIPVLTLIVLSFTVIAIYKQLRAQKKILKSQLLKDRITMGWQTDKPITENHIDNVRLLPSGYMQEKYKNKYTEMMGMDEGDEKKELNSEIGKYLYLSKIYDYFLYTYIVYIKDEKFKDPWGKDWQRQWLAELRKDKIFKDVMEFQQNAHFDFDEYLKGQMKGPVTENDFSDFRCSNKAKIFKFLVKKNIINEEGVVIAEIDRLDEYIKHFKKDIEIVKHILQRSKNANN